MTDIPIIFSAPMIRALLDGRKTMTRRLAWRSETDTRHMSFICDGERGDRTRIAKNAPVQMAGAYYLCPSPWQKVKPGDRLWVRETIVPCSLGFEYDAADAVGDDCIDLSDLTDEQVEFWIKRAGDDPDVSPKVSPIHMPRWASRLTLLVTATKIEKLQEISEADYKAEGGEHRLLKSAACAPRSLYVIGDAEAGDHKGAFEILFDKLHGAGTWDKNPECVAIAFSVEKKNIDTLPKVEAA